MINRATSTGVPLSLMVVLMASVFTVSMGYGIVLPLLPYVIEQLLGTGVDAAQVSRATGLLTALYTLALFLFAPAWGALSDRYGRRPILLIGLLGFSSTMFIFAFIDNLTAVYAERFLSGMFSAAVTPVAFAAIGDLATTEEARARRLTFVSLAGMSGFLIGPMLGVFVSRGAANILPIAGAAGLLALPLAGTAMLALLVAVAAAIVVPGTNQSRAPRQALPARFGDFALACPHVACTGIHCLCCGWRVRGWIGAARQTGTRADAIPDRPDVYRVQPGNVRRPGHRVLALDQARNHALVHRASTCHPGSRIISCSSRIRLHADARGDRSGSGERRDFVADFDLLDFEQGRHGARSRTRQADGGIEFGRHNGFGGRWSAVRCDLVA